MSLDPILNSDRDRRTWAWIVGEVGEVAARSVDLRGRRAYVSNIARALGLRPSPALERATRETAMASIAIIRQMMQERDAHR